MTTTFQLIGGHPALDLVNTLDNRFDAMRAIDRLKSYRDLLRFLQQSRLLTSRQRTALEDHAATVRAARVLKSVRELREIMAVLCYQRPRSRGTQDVLIRLDKWASKADAYREMVFAPAKNAPLAVWTWKPAVIELPTLPLWLLAASAKELVTSSSWGRMRCCRDDSCRWVFLDLSKNQSRSWCDMAVCGNRIKARRYQSRHRV
jgi:predicted RNA-binding Zn ribbon-like protein